MQASPSPGLLGVVGCCSPFDAIATANDADTPESRCSTIRKDRNPTSSPHRTSSSPKARASHCPWTASRPTRCRYCHRIGSKPASCLANTTLQACRHRIRCCRFRSWRRWGMSRRRGARSESPCSEPSRAPMRHNMRKEPVCEMQTGSFRGHMCAYND